MEVEEKHTKSILILGGTNFVGKTLLDFLQNHKQFQVYCLNRGKSYWNNQARKQHNFIHFSCDRKDHFDFSSMIGFINDKLQINSSNKWKAVIDFCAFKWRDIQSVVKQLQGKCQKYIFISSDSIYNNNEEEISLPIKEEDFDIFHRQKKQSKIKNKNDKYGYNKLKCQVYLKKTRYVPTICLRLPDVIGPYDNTDRFWCYVQWIKKSNIYPIPLSTQDLKKKLSFVYSKDVCRIILNIVLSQQTKESAYNIAFEQNPTLQELIRQIGNCMNKQVTFKSIKQKQSNNCYPSTQFGNIDISLAKKQLNFKPTPIGEAIQQTVHFFENKGKLFEKQLSQMKKMLQKKTKCNQ